ncbi:MAG: hypothetical protein GWP08_00835 [Nitrospiraceae bacterium]|nr:hypothetical protein [Nitrospiraceae bacterium]
MGNGQSRMAGVFHAILSNFPYVALLAGTVLWCVEKGPISWHLSHKYACILSIVAVAITVGFSMLRRCNPELAWPWHWRKMSPKGISSKILFAVLICTSIFGVFNYYKFDKKVLTTVRDYMDVIYYYTNSKYFDELGHFDLYPAILLADQEGPNRLKRIRSFRDLRTYKHVRRTSGLTPKRIKEIKDNFSPEQWQAFQHDVNFLTQHYRNWKYVMADRGYNPPATWTVVGGTLSSATPIEKMKYITMVDFVLMAIMFVVIARAYGMSVMLFALLWYSLTFSGRWPILGEALLRFDWVATSIMGICMLKMKRHAMAGGLMTYAALSRVFPAIFVFPYFVLMARDWIRDRKLATEHIRFLVGCTVVFTVLCGATYVRLGPKAFVETVENLSVHAKSYSSHRVGLGDALVYRGEQDKADLAKSGGIAGKKAQVNAMKPLLYAAGCATLALIIIYVFRTRHAAFNLIMLSTIPLFCMTNAQTNYYNLRLMLIIAHASDLKRWRNKVGLILLFLVETATQFAMYKGYMRYLVTTVMSYGMLVYFVVLIGFMIAEIIKPDLETDEPDTDDKVPRGEPESEPEPA